jgi:Lar family restriction alleviation protein
VSNENVAASAPVHRLVGQLLPCPFCGCEAKYKTYGQDGKWAFHQAECLSCGALQMLCDKSPDEVIRRWNARRVDVSHLQLMATNAGFKYWRASDAHGVTGTKKQAESFIADLIGVEVEICLPNAKDQGAGK